MLELAVGILLSLGAVDALIPLMIIVILIVAAAGATRGFSIFNIFGIATLAGIGAGRGSMQGRTALGRFFLLTQRPGSLGFRPGKKAVDKAKAMKERGIRIGGKQITKGSQYKKDMAAEAAKPERVAVRDKTLSGSVAGVPPPQKQSGKVKMAVSKVTASKPYVLGQKAVSKTMGSEGSGRRQLGRLAVTAFPGVKAGTLIYRKYKSRKAEGKAILPSRRNRAKRKTALDSRIGKFSKDQEQHQKLIDLESKVTPGVVFIPPSVKKQAGKDLKEGKITRAEYDDRLKKAGQKTRRSSSRFHLSGEKRAEARGMRLGKKLQKRATDRTARFDRAREDLKKDLDSGRITQEAYDEKMASLDNMQSVTLRGISQGVIAAQLGRAQATRDTLNLHIEKITDAQEAINSAHEDYKKGLISKERHDDIVTEQKGIISGAQEAYRKELKEWQKVTGVAGKHPFATQKGVIGATIGTGRAIGRAVKTKEFNYTKPGEIQEQVRNEHLEHLAQQGKGEDTHLEKRSETNYDLAVHRSLMKAAGFDSESRKAKRKRTASHQDEEGKGSE